MENKFNKAFGEIEFGKKFCYNCGATMTYDHDKGIFRCLLCGASE